MKRLSTFALVSALVITVGTGVAFAGNGAPSGPHYNINIIGHPKGYKGGGEDSNGRSIMIPLKNAVGPNAIICEEDQSILTDDTAPTWVTSEPTGAKIYFVPGDQFAILDRDATDSDGARIMIPTNGEANGDWITVDVYIRALGKPNTCMDIDAYAYDLDQGLWFWSGSVDLNRKTGKSTFIKANELFDVWFCQVDELGACEAGTTVELSVFNDVFENYFWNILNNGTRLVQVRLYPR